MAWKDARYPVACAAAVVKVSGYTYKGLGLHIWPRNKPRKRKGVEPPPPPPPEWTLTHLGSGLSVAHITGTVSEVFPLASQIADLSDWTFDGPKGFRNMDPELPAKLKAWLDTAPPCVRCVLNGTAKGMPGDWETRARQVLAFREGVTG